MIDRFPYEVNFINLIVKRNLLEVSVYDFQDDYVLKIASNRLNLSIFSHTSRGVSYMYQYLFLLTSFYVYARGSPKPSSQIFHTHDRGPIKPILLSIAAVAAYSLLFSLNNLFIEGSWHHYCFHLCVHSAAATLFFYDCKSVISLHYTLLLRQHFPGPFVSTAYSLYNQHATQIY